MTNYLAAMNARTINALNGFEATIQNLAGCTAQEARAVSNYYLANKIAKIDRHVGRVNVKHGAFLDVDVIRRAIEIAK